MALQGAGQPCLSVCLSCTHRGAVNEASAAPARFDLAVLPFSHSQSQEKQSGRGGSWSSSVSLELHWELWFPQRAAQDSLNEGKSTPLIRGQSRGEVDSSGRQFRGVC